MAISTRQISTITPWMLTDRRQVKFKNIYWPTLISSELITIFEESRGLTCCTLGGRVVGALLNFVSKSVQKKEKG